MSWSNTLSTRGYDPTVFRKLFIQEMMESKFIDHAIDNAIFYALRHKVNDCDAKCGSQCNLCYSCDTEYEMTCDPLDFKQI